MPHSQTYQSLILRAHDVGEADRFCVLLTRERGRLAARARAVRKTTSRLGGSVLPLQYVELSLHEGKAGYLVTGAKLIESFGTKQADAYLCAQQGIELLLQLLHDDEPVPEILDLTLEFLRHCVDGNPSLPLAYTVRLLDELGVLPDVSDAPLQSATACNFLEECKSDSWLRSHLEEVAARNEVETLCKGLISEQV